MDNNEAQMSALFEEGGIADDGMNVDPVSGNEIPPGSMASEVRDDIPAQLSEGEYVVPADVLRFYGVKFFEELRADAKMGLAGMEANGRIGGEPVPAEGQQEMSGLTPEEMSVLAEMGMAVGGMVPQPTQSTDPYMQQQQMYQQPAPVAMGNAGYNEGGVATPVNTAPDLLSQYGMGFSLNQDPTPATQPVSTVILYSPDGLTSEAFSLPTQEVQYDARIAEGWSPTQVAVTTETSVGNDDPNDYGNETGEGGKKFSEMSTKDLQKAYDDNKKAKIIMKGLSSINPVFGLLGMGATKHAENQILKAMEALSYKPIEDKEGEGIFSSIGDSIKSIFGGDKQEEPIKVYNKTENPIRYKDMQESAEASAQASLARAKETSVGQDGKGSDSGISAEEIMEAAKASRERNEAAGLGAQTKAGSMAGTKSGMFANEGGIVTKRTKKKKK